MMDEKYKEKLRRLVDSYKKSTTKEEEDKCFENMLSYMCGDSIESVADDTLEADYERAVKFIAEEGFESRLASKDGEFFILTAEFNPERINLYIENGIVIKTTIG
jgi:hypothetical protein